MKNRICTLKERLHDIIFESHTPEGRTFDVILIIAILSSSILVMIETIPQVYTKYENAINVGENIFFTAFFIEYVLRVFCSRRRMKYVTSFFGVIDLLAFLPALVGFFLPVANYFISIRIFRLLRLFRILKMFRYIGESRLLLRSLQASKPKITVFIVVVFSIVTIVGTLMYVIEGPQNGFNSIPESMYWAITTISTVGYGDISPQTGVGKFLASALMIVGYGILAVPTGIVSYEIANGIKNEQKPICPACSSSHDPEDAYCRRCGQKFSNNKPK